MKRRISLAVNTFLVFSLFAPLTVQALAPVQPKVEVIVQEAEKTWIENPYVLGGLGLMLVVLVALLIFLERKFHGLQRIFKNSKS